VQFTPLSHQYCIDAVYYTEEAIQFMSRLQREFFWRCNNSQAKSLHAGWPKSLSLPAIEKSLPISNRFRLLN